MVHRALASAAAVLLATAPFAAVAIESAPPLRTLAFTLELTITSTVDTPGATLTNGPRPALVVKGRVIGGGGVGVRGSGEGHAGDHLATTGKILVTVIGATDDAGLVVDIQEDAPSRMRPKIRVGIASDGSLLYDHHRAGDLSEEEIALMHWLARGFWGDHPREVGTSWTVDQSANGHSDVERYRVVARDDHRVTLEYALEEKLERVGGYAGAREGTLVYDTRLIVPVKATFDSIARRQVGDQYATHRSSVRLTLTEDSFAAAGRH